MAIANVYGLDSILIGAIAGDGGMGTSLSELIGQTVPGSAVLTKTADTIETVPIEESDLPIGTISTAVGEYSLAFSTYNLGPEVMSLIFGGAVTGTAPNQTWTPASSSPVVERSVQVVTKKGITFNFVRVSLTSALSVGVTKQSYGQLDITGTILEPTKVAEPAFTVDYGTGA